MSSNNKIRSLCLSFVCLCGGTYGYAADLKAITAHVSPAPTNSPLAQDWQRGTFMEIYVRGFQDSNGDGVGDLKGLTQRLDYLKALGISGIWLMPITRSQDNDHGYAVVDYRDIEPDYGTLADFDALIAEAHKRGIGVIMDYVINHSAADNPLFESARSSRTSPYRNWYVWQDEVPAGWTIYGKNPWYQDQNGAYFAGFWDQMPDFNLRNPEVIAFHHDNLRFWLNRGVDGFRFDAVGNLVEDGPLTWEGNPQNHVIMKGVQDLVASYGKRYIVCEAPGDPLAFGAATSCGSSFAFGHNNRIVTAAMGSPAAIEQVASYYTKAPMSMASFVSNHDSFAGQRLWDRVQGDVISYKLAAATNLLLSSTAFIYYGEEIGMSGGKGLGGDEKLRTPMSWTASEPAAGFSTVEPFRALSANHAENNVVAEQADPSSLLSFYRSLIALKQANPALRAGSYEALPQEGWEMSFLRRAGNQTVLTVFNFARDAGKVSVAKLPPNTSFKRLWPAYAETIESSAQGQIELIMPGGGFGVFEVDARP